MRLPALVLLVLPFYAIQVESAGPAVTKDSGKGLDAKRLASIPERMKFFVEKGNIAGSVTLVARHGQIAALDAVGYTDIEGKQRLRTDAIFQIHSMTKPVVAIAAMMLMEEGKLSLNDPVEKHLPEFRGMWVIESQDGEVSRKLIRPTRPVSIRDLMTHTSGMALNPPAGIGELHGALHKTLEEAVLVISQQPLGFQPGTRFQYSNTGIAALARIVEVASGRPFEEFLKTRIFTPLGMKDTFIYPPTQTHGRMPTAYILQNGKLLKYTADPLGEGAMKFREGARYPLPEGGLYSTATDLFVLYQMMLNRGQYNGVRVLAPSSVEMMTRVHTGDLSSAPGMGYGLAWAVARDAAAAPLSVGAYGHGGRYGTYCFIDPAKQMIGIFLIHREGGSEERNAFVGMAMASVLD
ncbi:MAG: beta-lactamase family protein [Bryobacteraceae bacterium]|nr:beta-lactamase family protein [Bryobacteraceae bacterium]